MFRLKNWDELPEIMQTDEIRKYYDVLKERHISIFIKRVLDLFTAITLFVLLTPLMAIIAFLIVLDSGMPFLFCQERVTTCGKRFKVVKFRTMNKSSDEEGIELTVNSSRVTRIGQFLRDHRIDEIPQLWNILMGDMSFVGARPEVPRYVDHYSRVMLATLFLPAGVTSEASICFQNEARLLSVSENAERTYIDEILPQKMEMNLHAIENFGLYTEFMVLIKTTLVLFGVVRNAHDGSTS